MPEGSKALRSSGGEGGGAPFNNHVKSHVSQNCFPTVRGGYITLSHKDRIGYGKSRFTQSKNFNNIICSLGHEDQEYVIGFWCTQQLWQLQGLKVHYIKQHFWGSVIEGRDMTQGCIIKIDVLNSRKLLMYHSSKSESKNYFWPKPKGGPFGLGQNWWRQILKW